MNMNYKSLAKLLFIICFPIIIGAQDVQQIHVDVVYLASDDLEGRSTGSSGEQLAAAYIASRMDALGLKAKGTTGWFQEFSFSSDPHDKTKKDITGRNVLGYLDRKAKKTIIIGAHYDHLGHGDAGSLAANDKSIHNGADDNASGVASLLWLAEQLVMDKKLACNVLFIAFSGEEHGLFGSKAFAEQPTVNMSDWIAMINMDMVGRLNAEHVIAISGTGTAKEWPSILDKVKPEGFTFNYSESGVGPSDHTSFYLKGLPVLHFFTGQHKDYHKPSDDSPLVNYKGIYQVSEIILNVIQRISKDGTLTFQKTKDENNEKAASFKVTLGIMPDYVYSGKGVRIDAVLDDRPAMKSGMKDGDIILKVGDLEIKDIYDYMKSLGMYKKGDKTKVHILRKDQELDVEVEF